MRDAYWELSQSGGSLRDRVARNPIVLGRKHCVGCGHWRHICDFESHRGCPRSRCRVCRLRYNREWKANATPERRETFNEYWRFWSEATGRYKGMRRSKRRRSVDEVERILLPVEPILGPLLDYLDDGGDIVTLARASGVSEKGIHRLLSGESRRIRLDNADKLAVALGLHLSLLYDYEEAA